MNKPWRSLSSFLFLILVWTGVPELQAQSGIFDRAGIIPDRGSYSSLPEESVDLFSGNLTLAYRDIFLPGKNGLNIEVWRVYNSKILQDKLSSQQNPTVQAYPKSMIGIGWTMHMGIVHNAYSSTPVIEFPDGRRETAFPPKSAYGWTQLNYCRITRDFLKYYCAPGNDPRLYFPNGVVWTFGNIASLPLANGSSETVYMVTHIEDPQGNYIDIEYDPVDNLRSIKRITDSMDREVRFISTAHGSDPRTLAEIRIRNHDDTHDVVHSYSVGSFLNGFYRLESYTPPELPSTTFEYNDGQSNNFELTRMTSSYGGVLEYSYENHNFFLNTTQLDSKVVSQKRITFNPGEDTQVWNYTYPTYQGVSSGTATVQGPEFSTEITSYAYNSQNAWRMGLETARAVGDGSSSSSCSWTYHEVSDTTWSSFGVSMGKARGPLASSSTTSLTGDATLRQDFLYLRDAVKKFGLPTKVSVFVNGSPIAKSHKELTYFWEGHSSYLGKFMLSFVDNMKDKSGSGALLREATSSYYEETGKWGAIKQVQKLKAPSVYYTWGYDHDNPNPHYVTTTIDGPGSGGISTVSSDYGLEREASAPTYLKYRRQISKYSYVRFERNQFGGSKGYDYDDLGRLTSLTLRNEWDDDCDPPQTPPAPFLTIGYTWRPDGRNEVVITNGGSTITKYWDGMGRDTGYTETGDGTTLHYRRALDAEGRVKNENKGSVNPDHRYSYLYDNAGRVTRVTDPMNEVSEISYSARTRTLTDPEDHSTAYEYNDLPGQPTRLTDAQGHIANNTYDALGRLTQVVYNGGRTQSYQYDGLDNVTREIHPETGTIDYIYNAENRLGQKNWGGASYLFGYASGQLITFAGAETVTYGYNDEGAVTSVAGSTGWSRTGIGYDDFGAITHETITIPGLAEPKSLSYEYDANGNLTKTTYPDGKEAVLASNDLGRPETLTFNTNTLVNSAAYGPNKLPASVSVAGNGTTMSSTFYSNGTPNTISLMKGSTPLYNATYAYDGAGNITGISSTAPAPALNTTFAYDSLNRLISATYSTGDQGAPGTYGYEYDAYGNMLTVRHNGSTIAFDKDYDSQNRIDDLTYQYDARGNLTSKEGKSYIWDAQNRLRAVSDASGQIAAEYVYDDRGLRIASLAPKPDIDIVGYPAGSSAHFASNLQTPCYKTFTVFNRGYGSLNLGPLSIDDPVMFSITQQPASPVLPGQSTQFTVRFLPTASGDTDALLSIASNDPDAGENPYNITLNGYCVPDTEISGAPQGGTYDFGTVTIGQSKLEPFDLLNTGTATLLLYGAPSIENQGGGTEFYMESGTFPPQMPYGGSPVPFAIRFAPTGEGLRMATLTVLSSDPNENPYTVTLVGTGLNGGQKIIDGSELTLLSPNGGETLESGSFRDIRWTGGEKAKCVKIEYSTDNGTTYRTIADRVANIGSFPWAVPDEASGSCLVRISDADGAPAIPAIISFQFNFKVQAAGDEDLADSHFVFRAGVPDARTQSFQVAEVAFAPDGVRGTENLLFNHALGEIPRPGTFLGRWHRARIAYDLTDYTGSVWIDNEPVLAGVPLRADLDVQASPEISLIRDGALPVEIWIDDVGVELLDLSRAGEAASGLAFRPLFRDNFGRYESSLFPRQGGWRPMRTEVRGEAAEEGAEMLGAAREEEAASIDDRVYASSDRSFKLGGSEEEPGRATKRFSLPERVPFCVSAEPFAVAATGEPEPAEGRSVSSRDRETRSTRQKRWDSRKEGRTRHPSGRSAPASSSPSAGPVRNVPSEGTEEAKLMSGVPVTETFFIYAFDGRLLAEYDVAGTLVRDYVYFGGQLIAEYRNAGSQLLYYTSDQINSTRIVTDSSGTVVFAAAHEPYGGIQKTWGVTTYDPALKFSGKPRDAESELDYFGARYYDRSLYRFLSVDPVIPAGSAVANPRRWNLYAYCLNNPVSYVDPTGADPQKIIIEIVRYREESGFCYGTLSVNGTFVCWTLENSQWKIESKTYGADLTTVDGEIVIQLRNARKYVYDPITRNTTAYEAAIKKGLNISNAHNCIYVTYVAPNSGKTIMSGEAWLDLMEYINKCQVDMARHAFEAMDYVERSSYAHGPCDMFFNAMGGLEALSWMLGDWYRMQLEIQVVIKQDQ